MDHPDEGILIAADPGILALFDPLAYESFLSDDFEPSEFEDHLVSQMGQHRILVWSANAGGNWRTSVSLGHTSRSGWEDAVGSIRVTGDRLGLIAWEELFEAATESGVSYRNDYRGCVSLAPGDYDVRIVKLFDPSTAQDPDVYGGDQTGFLVELESNADGNLWEPWSGILWT